MLWVLCEYRNQIRDCLINTTVTVFDFRTRSISQISMAPTVFFFFFFFFFFFCNLLFLSFFLFFSFFGKLSFFLRVLFLWVSLIYISSLSVCCLLIMILHSFELYFWSYSKAWPMRFSRYSLGFAARESILYRRLYRFGQRYDIFRIPVNTVVPFWVYCYFLYFINYFFLPLKFKFIENKNVI